MRRLRSLRVPLLLAAVLAWHLILPSPAAAAPKPKPPSQASVTVTPEMVTVTEGGSAQLTVVVTNDRGAPVKKPRVAWSTSAAGVATVDSGGLVRGVSAGTAVITATSNGRSGTATVTVTAPGGPPTIEITAPADGSAYTPADDVIFTAEAFDIPDGDLSASVLWTGIVLIDGTEAFSMGRGETTTLDLSAFGSVTIRVTASITDSDGNAATDSVDILVTRNTSPALRFIAPTEASTYGDDVPIGFEATAGDVEDGDLDDVIGPGIADRFSPYWAEDRPSGSGASGMEP